MSLIHLKLYSNISVSYLNKSNITRKINTLVTKGMLCEFNNTNDCTCSLYEHVLTNKCFIIISIRNQLAYVIKRS